MALSSEQRRIAGILLREADRFGATPREREALIEAGIVESGLRNLSYGDRDSQGVLQQRPSQGWGTVAQVRNPSRAARIFLQRARAARGVRGGSGNLAQAVQRSAHPGRYEAVDAQAESIIRQLGRGGSGGSRGGGGGSAGTPSPGSGPDRPQNIAALLETMLGGGAARAAVSVPEVPDYNRASPVPRFEPDTPVKDPETGEIVRFEPTYTTPQSSGISAQDSPSIAAALSTPPELPAAANPLIEALKLAEGREIPAPPGRSESDGDSGGGGSSGGGRRGLPRPSGAYSGTEGIIRPLSKIAQSDFNLRTSSAKRDTVSTASGNVSDHFRGNTRATARDWAGTPRQMNSFARYLARELGIKNYQPGTIRNVNRGGFRYQLIWGTSDHRDHVHLGIKRL